MRKRTIRSEHTIDSAEASQDTGLERFRVSATAFRSLLLQGRQIVLNHRPQPDQHVLVLAWICDNLICSSSMLSMEWASSSGMLQPR